MQASKKRNYSIVAACFTIQAVGVGILVSYGVFFNSLMIEFQWSRAVISGASSLALFLSGLLAIFVGRLNDIYGPKRLMSIAAIFLGTGVMLMSQVEEVWQLYLFYGVIFGIGYSAVDVIALTTTARWFSHSRGIMTGIVKVGTGAGQFTIPFLASVLIAIYGWRQTNVILGAAALVIILLVAQVLKRDPGDSCAEINPNGNGATKSSGIEFSSLSAREALQTAQMWIICSVNLLLVFTLMIILVHIVPHASDIGLSPFQSAGVLSTIGAVSMLGRFISGLTIDRVGSKYVMVACYFVLIASLIWLQFTDSLWMLYLFACAYGLAHGGFFTAISPIVAEIFGIAAHGAIFGIVVFFGTTGGAIGPLAAGQLFDMTGSYTVTFRAITAMSVAGLGLILLLKPIEKTRDRVPVG